MKSTLEYRNGHLCVLNRSKLSPKNPEFPLGTLCEWYPVKEATEDEAAMLVRRTLITVEPDEGLYVDEEGNPYQLSERGRTRPVAVEMTPALNDPEPTNHEEENGIHTQPRLDAMAEERASTARAASSITPKALLKRPRRKRRANAAGCGSNGHSNHDQLGGQACSRSSNIPFGGEESAGDESPTGNIRNSGTAALNLRQKLALVRRRLGYIQKRGLNEVHSYRYVTAADIAGAVGDILAELGVVVLPRLQSISHEPARPGRSDSEHLTRVVMSYTFADVDTAEEIMVKVAGEGLDAGDKAPYKAMTGALKYALLQSFLLATGDDPEDERSDSRATISAERVITPEQARELQRLIEETGTELERVLAYYKVSALSELTEASYRRALELLNRKLAKMNPENGVHA
jgi:ERF superfamily